MSHVLQNGFMSFPNSDVAFGVSETTTDIITFNSSDKIAFISSMLSFNEKMLEYLRSMDLIIIEVPHPNSLYASNVKSYIDCAEGTVPKGCDVGHSTAGVNEEIKVDTYEEYEMFITKVPNIVNVACRLGENSITLCYDKKNYKPYCVKFVMDRTHDLSYMNFRSSLNMYGELVLYKNLYIKNVKYALNYNKNCIDNKKFYKHKLYYSKKNCISKICTECYKSINYTFCDISKCKECYKVYITPKKYTIDHTAVDNWRELKYIDFFNKLHYNSSLDNFSTSAKNCGSK